MARSSAASTGIGSNTSRCSTDSTKSGRSFTCASAMVTPATTASHRLTRRDTGFLATLGAMSAPLTIEVVSDVICPWCYIGKRRLGKALAALAGEVSAEIRWLPFQLNPSMPAAGMPRAEYRARKFGSLERSRELDARVAMEGKSEGIGFAFDRIERTPNTVAAHALVGLAQQQGLA